MTDKELHKLSRLELLKLFLEQSKELAALKEKDQKNRERLSALENEIGSLRNELEEKQGEIDRLLTTVHQEDRSKEAEEALQNVENIPEPQPDASFIDFSDDDEDHCQEETAVQSGMDWTSLVSLSCDDDLDKKE